MAGGSKTSRLACLGGSSLDLFAVTILDRRRFTAQRRDPGVRPYLVVTDDLAELRDALNAGKALPG